LAAGCLHKSGSRLPQSKVKVRGPRSNEQKKEATIMTIVASFDALQSQEFFS
jgi:hypothetical protein